MPVVTKAENSVKKFYRYFLTQNAPLHIVDATHDWKANQNWVNATYVFEQFGRSLMKAKVLTSTTRDPNAAQYGYDRFIFDLSNQPGDYHKEGVVEEVNRDMRSFLEERAGSKDVVLKDNFTPDKGETQKSAKPDMVKMLYLDNTLSAIQLNQNLLNDIVLPDFLGKYLRLHKIGLTMWGEFIRKPYFSLKERLVCVIQGSEKFRLVNAIFK